MVIFQKIQIENYKSIGNVTILPQSGLYKVVGENLDSSYTSNGAAKSSSVQAVMLGLYNRDFTGAPLDSLSNRVTKKPFKITIDFVWDSRNVTVINDRSANTMLLTIDGKKVAKGAKTVVPEVEKMLGMGWATFKLTHFITGATIMDLTQNLSEPQLFNDILHLVELKILEKKFANIFKDIESKRDSISHEVNSLEKTKELLSIKDNYHVEELESTRDLLQNKLAELDSKYHDTIVSNLTELREEVRSLEQALESTRASLRSGVCSMCGSILLDKDTLRMLNSQLENMETSLTNSNAIYTEAEVFNKKLAVSYQEARDEINRSLHKVEADILIAKELGQLPDISVDLSSKLSELEIADKEYYIATSARKQLKSGGIIKDIMDKFFALVQLKLNEYLCLINLEQFTITIGVAKLGMVINLYSDGDYVAIESLSNGEKTRLSILVLISMLDAMKCVSNSETNLLVFDEASSSFDASGVEELSKLFNYLKNLGQAIFLITHGSELDEVPYDFELRATKQGGISSVTVTHV